MRLFGFDIRRVKDKPSTIPEGYISVPESHVRLSQFFPELQKAALNSEEHYDQKVFAISAGAIGVELAILQLFTSSPRGIGFAIASVSCFIIALILNLIVHYIAKNKQDKQSDIIREFLNSNKEDDTAIYSLIRKDNKVLSKINFVSIVFLVVGIVCLAIFTFTNLITYGQ